MANLWRDISCLHTKFGCYGGGGIGGGGFTLDKNYPKAIGGGTSSLMPWNYVWVGVPSLPKEFNCFLAWSGKAK